MKGRAKKVPYKGREVSLSELSQRTGINLHTLRWRSGRGVSGSDLLKKPGYRVINHPLAT